MDEEDVLMRHRQEKKDLQAKITGFKKNIPKNDKKKKKEIMDEISKLEHEMKERHERELDQFHRTCFGNIDKSELGDSNANADLTNIPAIEKLTLTDEDDGGEEEEEDEDGEEGNDNEIGNKFYQIRKISKAQRKRDKKAQKEKEKRKRIESETRDLYENSSKKLEEDRFKVILDGLGLEVYDIPSDGDCMFKALEHQLSLQGIKTSVQELRSSCAAELRKRRVDFMPFLFDSEVDAALDEKSYETYCNKIENTKCWGGNVELQALSYALSVPIKIIQATGPSVEIGTERFSSKPLIISYHRHAYQLGEHYNSIIPVGTKVH